MKIFVRLGFFVGLVIAFLYYLRRRAEEEGGGQAIGPKGTNSFIFDPNVTRRVEVNAPDQNGHPLRVEADPPGEVPDTPPPPGKGIQALVVPVITPRVIDLVTQQELTYFDPPLTFVVHYRDQDVGPDGDPAQLFLGVYYRAKEGWRWQKLDTDVNANAKTLTAQIRTLMPSDPVGVMK